MSMKTIFLAVVSILAVSSMALAAKVTVTTVVDKDEKEKPASALYQAIVGSGSYNQKDGEVTLGYTQCTLSQMPADRGSVSCDVDDKPGVYGDASKSLYKALQDAGIKYYPGYGNAIIVIDEVKCSNYKEGSVSVPVCDIKISE